MDMQLTNHANRRQQQRSICNLEIELLLMYGQEANHGDGSTMRYFDKKGYKRLVRDLRRVSQRLERLKTEYLIEADGEYVVTVGHRYRHINTK